MFQVARRPFNPDPIIRQEICEAIWPFNPGLVTLFLVADVLDPVVFIESSTFEHDKFVFDGRELYLVEGGVDEMATYLGVQAGKYFVSLMNEPIPSNIILGDN